MCFVYFAYVMFLSSFVMFFIRTLKTREAVSLHVKIYLIARNIKKSYYIKGSVREK